MATRTQLPRRLSTGGKLSEPYPFLYTMRESTTKATNFNTDFTVTSGATFLQAPGDFWVELDTLSVVIRGMDLELDVYSGAGALPNGIILRMLDEVGEEEFKETITTLGSWAIVGDHTLVEEMLPPDSDTFVAKIGGARDAILLRPNWRILLEFFDDFTDLDIHNFLVTGSFFFDTTIVSGDDFKTLWPFRQENL